MNYRAFIEYSISLRKIVRIIQELIHGYVPLILDVLLRNTEETILTKRTYVEHIIRHRDIHDCQILNLVLGYESQSNRTIITSLDMVFLWLFGSVCVMIHKCSPLSKLTGLSTNHKDSPSIITMVAKTYCIFSSVSRWEWETLNISLYPNEKN